MIKTIGIGVKPKNTRNIFEEIQNKLEKESNLLFFLTFLHLPVGIFLYASGSLGLLHQVVVFSLGLYWAVSTKVKLDRIAYLITYLIGCEILWRMAQTSVFWEIGKYSASFIMIVALIRRGHYMPPALPTVFVLLLIPACAITLLSNDLSIAREKISFNLSGPFFLFISCWFFSYLKLVNLQIRKLFIVLLIPLLTVAFTTLLYTVTTEEISFSTESNFATSGGFGPNQVSSMLGLGVFIGMTCYLMYQNDLKFKFYFALGALFLAAQSVLTFSRGGIYNALGAIVILVLFQMQNINETAKRILPFVLVFVVFFALVFPFLNDFTGGKLSERFEDTETTGRLDIIESDFQILAENPIWGVGLGNAMEYREKYLGRIKSSHTEFSRLISEHGFFGILAILLLISIAGYNFLRQDSVFGRALIAGTVVWCCLFMLNAGMRLAAPSFLWGLSCVNIVGTQLERKRKIIPINNKSTKSLK